MSVFEFELKSTGNFLFGSGKKCALNTFGFGVDYVARSLEDRCAITATETLKLRKYQTITVHFISISSEQFPHQLTHI